MNTMEAGRELDTLVAHRVFGWPLRTQEDMRQEAEAVWQTQPNCRHFLTGFEAVERKNGLWVFAPSVRRYSTEIEAAWLVIEALTKKHYDITLYWEERFGLWICDPWLPPDGPEGTGANGATAPLAICRAALSINE